MDLIKYHQTTCHLLQEEFIEETILYGITYNLYSHMELVDRNNITYLNGLIHGTYNRRGNITIFNRGKLISYLSRDMSYSEKEINYRGILFKIEDNKLTNYDEVISKLSIPRKFFTRFDHTTCKECHKLIHSYDSKNNVINFFFSCVDDELCNGIYK